MSYPLPDEPLGAIRPDLAVNPVWPLLALMIAGPLPGFVWLAFNSWALGCRLAMRHTLVGALVIPALGLATLALQHGAPRFFDEYAVLGYRLGLVFIQATALGLAFWIMLDQDEAQEWRAVHGTPLARGLPVFFLLAMGAILLADALPSQVRVFVFWVGG